jgi:hypothetical protein
MKNLDDSSENIIRSFDPIKEKSGISVPIFGILIVVIIVAGILTGLLLSKLQKPSTSTLVSNGQKGNVVGTVDKKTFKDTAEGILKEGGINGEGNFHLERPGGESQNVYLTSGTVDLTQFVGKKVKVWGATFQGQAAGWLMDVGSVETL